eukprot:12911516-Prorocentrum_lima.AAC.1
MHSSMWLMIKGTRPRDQQVFAEPVPPDKFAETQHKDQRISRTQDKQSGSAEGFGTALEQCQHQNI